MYRFIRGQWILGKIQEEKLLSFVPRWITQEEAEEIMKCQQNGDLFQ